MAGINRDYERVERAIRFIFENQGNQPGLEEVAAAVHLSPAHFQRLFQRWAGVSPKQFLQCLTVQRAKEVLDSNKSVLEVADSVGLSGAGRLHDHFVTLEGMSPGEFRSGGVGIDFTYDIGDSPFGEFLVVTGPRGAICHLVFLDDTGIDGALAPLRERWPQASLLRSAGASDEVAGLLAGRDAGRHILLTPVASNFKLNVWRALLQIPEGQLVSYQQLAMLAGNASATRAVASAVAANPIAWLIPCHRVIRSTGVIGQYRWGSERKQALIGWEGAKALSAEIKALSGDRSP